MGYEGVYIQDRVGRVTLLSRRKVDKVDESYGVDVSEEEQRGRLTQHVEGIQVHVSNYNTE